VDGELSYPDLAEDIAAEARPPLALTTEIRDMERKIAALLHQLRTQPTFVAWM